MLGFTPFKKHANKFNYTPRFYDPAKEERERRRAELRGERSDTPHEEYRPGQYIRAQRNAREEKKTRRNRNEGYSRKKIWIYLILALLGLYCIQRVYPVLSEFFVNLTQKPMHEEVVEYGDFDPSAPITIVPNDYQEGE